MPTPTPELQAEVPNANVVAAFELIRGLSEGGAALTIGAVDRGKTTLVATVAQRLATAFERVAVVDSDIGQSEIGPPGTVGVGWATAEATRLHDLRPVATFFVGGITPRAVALEWVAATAAAIAWARRAGANRILIDTHGDVTGQGARRLFAALALAALPDAVIALLPPEGTPSDGDAVPALAALSALPGNAKVLELTADADARRKPDARRSLIRRTRLFAALENAGELRLSVFASANDDATASARRPARIRTLGTALGAGTVVAPHLVRWIGETLHLTAGDGRYALPATLHAEIDAGILTVFADTGQTIPPSETTRSGIVAQHFGVSAVRVLPVSGLVGAYVGLIGEGGLVLGVGRFEGIAAETGEVRVFAGLRGGTSGIERVRILQFGRFRLGRDGAFLSDIRPGEI